MIMPPFEGPRLKVRQAKHHIESLQLIVNEFQSRVDLKLAQVGRKGDLII